jgi:hypothetical protein
MDGAGLDRGAQHFDRVFRSGVVIGRFSMRPTPDAGGKEKT